MRLGREEKIKELAPVSCVDGKWGKRRRPTSFLLVVEKGRGGDRSRLVNHTAITETPKGK